MATLNVPRGASGGNPSDDILAKLTGLQPITARVGVDVDVRAITVELSAWGGWQMLLVPRHARALALRILNALERLERLPADEEEAQTPYDPEG